MKGPGFWKFNNSHVKDKDFVDQVNKIFDVAEYRYSEMSPPNKWEQIKQDIKEFAVQYSKEKAGKRREKIVRIEKQLRAAHIKLAMINLRSHQAVSIIQKVNNKIDGFKRELEKENLYHVKGVMLRSKAKWVAEGQQNSKYFFSLEKRNAKAKIMQTTQMANGEVTRDPKKVLQIQKSFYQNLYTADLNLDPKIEIEPEKKLDATQKVLLDSQISIEEIQEAIKATARNKSPGSDGFGIEIYIIFFNKMKDLLLSVYNCAYAQNNLHASAKYGIISLIPKLGRNLNLIKNWRPIVLLNSDLKILTKIFASRLKLVLPDIIHTDQTGFLAGRAISSNMRKILDVIDFTDMNNIPALLLSIDFEKAFDRVHYNALEKVLKWFSFGPVFRSWIKLFYEGFSLVTLNNGFASPQIRPTRGLFQGNPISPYLFLLQIELLAVMVRRNKHIKGVKINDTEHLLIQFADDLGMCLAYDRKSWCEALKTLHDFEAKTGLKINYDKSSVYRIGSLKNSNAKFYSTKKLQWTNDPINVLGILITTEKNEIIQKNLEPAMEKAKNVLKLWVHRNLALFGKILLCNTLVASLFVYKLTVLHNIPVEYFEKITKIFTEFIWNGKRPKIATKILMGEKLQGGAGLANMHLRNQALKLSWIPKLQKDEKLRNLANALLKNPLNQEIWKCNLSERDCENHFKSKNFWREVLKNWCVINHKEPSSTIDVQNQIIWFNSYVRRDGNIVAWKNWIEKGILRVKDLIDANGQFLTQGDISTKYELEANFMEYYGIISAIPHRWKSLLINQKGDSEPLLIEQITVMARPVSLMYKKLNFDENLVSTKWIMWKHEMNKEIDYNKFIKNVTNINNFTICTKLRSFQYKFLMRATVTNVQLHRWKILNTDLCSFCNNNKETIFHLFYDCPKVYPIWRYIQEIIKIDLTFGDIVFIDINPNASRIENCIVLVTKFYIYRTRCLNERLSTNACKNYICSYKEIEYEIAKQKHKLAIHGKKDDIEI